jgi:PhzF family phenazine biosynthesis protein
MGKGPSMYRTGEINKNEDINTTDEMKRINVACYEAFTEMQGRGNPAGVVFDGDSLTEDEMQVIAREVGFNETAFILSSSIADLRLRYFTPGHEMNLCGHGTVASIFGYMERNKVHSSREINIETLAGILKVHYDYEHKEIKMEQAPAEFLLFQGDVDRLAASIGIVREDIDLSLPIVYGSTGIWTLIVPIRQVGTFLRMKPNNKEFKEILTQRPTASVHPICMETYDKTCAMHGRHFSASRSGTVEDPVTGTASGVMGAYYIEYVDRCNQAEIIVEQGYEMGKKGLVRVRAERRDEQIQVRIAGKAVFIREWEIVL